MAEEWSNGEPGRNFEWWNEPDEMKGQFCSWNDFEWSTGKATEMQRRCRNERLNEMNWRWAGDEEKDRQTEKER